MSAKFDVAEVRKRFPALNGKQVYLDNAGGSQVLQEVVDSISNYLCQTNVQLGASYPVSQQSTDRYNQGCEATATYMKTTPDCVVLGPSTTQLFRNLSLALFDHLAPGSEIVISKLDHEANVASWLQLAKWRQAKVIWWDATDKKNPQLDCDVLRSIMTENTRLVACTQTSNILGTIHDVKAIAQTVHEVPGALLCVDAVAFAPHAGIDVEDWGVDFYCFSWYKVYGPHIAAMYGSKAAQKYLSTLGHFFKPTETLENLLGLAGASYELLASVPKVCDYLAAIPWEAIAHHEEKLQGILIDHLNSKPELYQIYGEPSADRTKRVPVISFTVKDKKSKDIVDAIEARSDFGCRWGSFYSNRLVSEVLALDAADGVVRVSLVHYNTEDELRGLIGVLDQVTSES